MAAIFFVLLAFFFVISTFIALSVKKRVYLTQKKVEKRFELFITKAMLDEWDDAEDGFVIPKNFGRHFRSKIKRQYAIDALIQGKKNLRGKAAENIVKLYLKLGFKNDSIKKFKSGTWQIKARGIHELYMMDQKDMLKQIYKHANSVNDFVRMESQIAMIHFLGFDGLRFLDVISTPVSEWQQVRLLEQLRPLEPDKMPGLKTWLHSKNDSVVLFALKLADIYQQFDAYAYVLDCLSHKNEQVRIQAVKTLIRIANDTTALSLTEQYKKERFTNRLNILTHLSGVASGAEQAFLEQEIESENQFLQLAAAKVLAESCSDGLEYLQAKAIVAPKKYEDIYKHVKFQVSR